MMRGATMTMMMTRIVSGEDGGGLCWRRDVENDEVVAARSTARSRVSGGGVGVVARRHRRRRRRRRRRALGSSRLGSDPARMEDTPRTCVGECVMEWCTRNARRGAQRFSKRTPDLGMQTRVNVAKASMRKRRTK
ncbi:PREDICTED: uncharacterized protein LOC108754409 [Trachymyrmex septentrionalis]|uniref:uncharacterized protein LOC108754409 n=1 Tax=Trachymyrmex septentrionalis TaxID=34720 RepID=UPI00084EEF41|nr:PREDICTED: uncharacterized protein LOC108754409 [Trachymyrmex septentrionalis]